MLLLQLKGIEKHRDKEEKKKKNTRMMKHIAE